MDEGPRLMPRPFFVFEPEFRDAYRRVPESEPNNERVSAGRHFLATISNCTSHNPEEPAMNETVQQYVQRIQGKIAGRDPLRTQSETAKRLSGLLKRGTPAKLKKRPAPENGPWLRFSRTSPT